MKIQSLKLENFQGIAHAEFELNGLSASIYGDNSTGKTTVYNAFTWLLFEKDSTGAAGYTPKTKGPDGDLHNLDHSAEAAVVMSGGEIVTLKKVYHEVWKKKRGSTVEEFDKHTTDHYINRVPYSNEEYKRILERYCGGAERMKMLTMPDYFPETMNWKQRREILLELCGDITDADVIASNGKLTELADVLRKPGSKDQFYSVDEYRETAEAEKKSINKNLAKIPTQINENALNIQKMMQGGRTQVEISEAIDRGNARRKELLDQRTAFLAGDTAVSEARKKTAEAEAALASAKSDYMARASEVNAQTVEEISRQAVELSKAKSKASEETGRAKELRANIKRMTEQRERMHRELDEIKSEYAARQKEVWDTEQETCPRCGQKLPADRIDTMKADFNQRKSDGLIALTSQYAALNEKGKAECSLNMIQAATRQAEEAETAAELAEADAEQIQEQIDALRANLTRPPAFETTQEYFDLSGQITACRAAERESAIGGGADTSNIDGQIQALDQELEELQKMRTLHEQVEVHRQRIAELETEEKELAAKYEEFERGINLCNEFIKAKVRMLTDRINGKFQNVRFRLFQEQLNGGVKDDCEVLIPNEKGAMVPYRNANKAGRFNAGLEIIGVLSDHWGMQMPVFIDNSESVQKIVETGAQVIQLIVPPTWDKLGEIARDALIDKYGSEEQARNAYETPGKTLRMEIQY